MNHTLAQLRRQHMMAVIAVGEVYALRGNVWAGMVARRASAATGWEQYETLVAPLAREPDAALPEPLRLLLLDEPTGGDDAAS